MGIFGLGTHKVQNHMTRKILNILELDIDLMIALLQHLLQKPPQLKQPPRLQQVKK